MDHGEASSYPRFDFSVTFPQIDWAGRIFYSRIFEIAQAAMERFLTDTPIGPIEKLIKAGKLPVVIHVESDYRDLLTLGDALSVEISCIHIGNTSFILRYDFFKNKDRKKKETQETWAAQVKVVHVLMTGRGRKTSLPTLWRKVLQDIYRPNHT